MSKFLKNVDINAKPVDPIDTFDNHVDFFHFFRHICHNIGLD